MRTRSPDIIFSFRYKNTFFFLKSSVCLNAQCVKMIRNHFNHYKPLWEVWLCISYWRVHLFKILFTSLKIWHALKWCYYTSSHIRSFLSIRVCPGVFWRSEKTWACIPRIAKRKRESQLWKTQAKPSRKVHRRNYSEKCSFLDWILCSLLAVFTLSCSLTKSTWWDKMFCIRLRFTRRKCS